MNFSSQVILDYLTVKKGRRKVHQIRNARLELEKDLSDYGYDVLDIKCADLSGEDDEFEQFDLACLRVKHTQEDLEQFLQVLGKYNYESTFGSQKLFGIVWLRDGVWLERGEYDGSEWWEVKKCPLIPDYLLDKEPE